MSQALREDPDSQVHLRDWAATSTHASAALASGSFLALFYLLPPTSPWPLAADTPGGTLPTSASLQWVPRGSCWAASLKKRVSHWPCTEDISESRRMCPWGEGQGIPSRLLWDIKLPEPNCGFGEGVFFPLVADRVQSNTTQPLPKTSGWEPAAGSPG